MGERRATDDAAPRRLARVTAEEHGAVRYELPVRVGVLPGLLVIRVFDGKDDPEVSIRGYAADRLRP